MKVSARQAAAVGVAALLGFLVYRQWFTGRKRAPGFGEVSDNVFAIFNPSTGEYQRCEDSDGNILPDCKCAGCGIWGEGSGDRDPVKGCPPKSC